MFFWQTHVVGYCWWMLAVKTRELMLFAIIEVYQPSSTIKQPNQSAVIMAYDRVFLGWYRCIFCLYTIERPGGASICRWLAECVVRALPVDCWLPSPEHMFITDPHLCCGRVFFGWTSTTGKNLQWNHRCGHRNPTLNINCRLTNVDPDYQHSTCTNFSNRQLPPLASWTNQCQPTITQNFPYICLMFTCVIEVILGESSFFIVITINQYKPT